MFAQLNGVASDTTQFFRKYSFVTKRSWFMEEKKKMILNKLQA